MGLPGIAIDESTGKGEDDDPGSLLWLSSDSLFTDLFSPIWYGFRFLLLPPLSDESDVGSDVTSEEESPDA